MPAFRRPVSVPIEFDPDLFEVLRKQAEREGVTIGAVVVDIVLREIGG